MLTPNAAAEGVVALSPPARLGPFRLEREIGRGGFGVVYEAHDVETSSVVALKVLTATRAEAIASFKREARDVADLCHPNILVPLELFNVGSYWCFSMELVRGTDIVTYVRSAPLEAQHRRVEHVFRQLAHAVGSLHAEGLVHLDLKPANVMVREDGHVFVLDFGIARTTEGGEGSSGALSGTPRYAAPELSAGRMPSCPSDWYSVGVMLQEASTGGSGPVESSFASLCTWLLDEDPDRRPDAAKVLDALGDSRPLRFPRRARHLLGRERELDTLRRAFEEGRLEGGVSVLLAGSGGVGKTTLVREFLDRVDVECAAVVGRCHARESVAYSGLDTIVGALVDEAARLPAAARESLLSDGMAEAARMFPVLEPLAAAGSFACATSDPHVFRRRAAGALRAFVGGLARARPLIVFLDDAHWADDDTLALWTEIFAGAPGLPVVGIVACREDERQVHSWRRGLLSRARRLEELLVAPLSRIVSERLASELVDASSRAGDVVEAAGGNPFLIEELARSPSLDVPHGGDPLQLLVGARVASLTAEAREVLNLAALAGRPLSRSTLFDAAGEASSTYRILSELHRAAFVRSRSAPPRVELRHDRLRDALLKAADPESLPAAHARLADAFESHGEPAADTAVHFEKAGRLAAAKAHYVRAAAYAGESFAFEAASRHYASAIRMGVATGDEHAQLEGLRAESLYNCGRCAEAAPAFVRSAELDPIHAAERRLRATDSWLVAGRIEDGLATAARVSDEFAAHVDREGLRIGASVALRLVRLLARGTRHRRRHASVLATGALQGDLCWTLAKGLMYVTPLQATDFLVRALESALDVQDEFRTGRCLGLLGAGMFLQVPGLRTIGTSYLVQAEAIGRKLRDPYLLAMDDVWGAFADMYEGRWDSMLLRSERGRARLEKECAGTAWESVIARGLSTWSMQFLGRLRRSGESAAAGLDDAVERGDLYGEVLFSQYLAFAEMAAGKVTAARARIAGAAQKWTVRRYTVPSFYAMALHAMCDLLEDRPRDARERLASDRSNFRRSGGHLAPMSRIDEGLLRARVHLRDPVVHGARELGQLAAQMDREKRPDGPGHGAFIRAAVAARQGRRTEASSYWARSEERYLGAGMALHAATARMRRGELVDDRSLVADARATIEALGVADTTTWSNTFMPSGMD